MFVEKPKPKSINQMYLINPHPIQKESCSWSLVISNRVPHFPALSHFPSSSLKVHLSLSSKVVYTSSILSPIVLPILFSLLYIQTQRYTETHPVSFLYSRSGPNTRILNKPNANPYKSCTKPPSHLPSLQTPAQICSFFPPSPPLLLPLRYIPPGVPTPLPGLKCPTLPPPPPPPAFCCA